MTVHGLDHFTQAMSGVEDAFVVIGGIAAALLLEGADLDARVTKDVDIVLVAKELCSLCRKAQGIRLSWRLRGRQETGRQPSLLPLSQANGRGMSEDDRIVLD